LHQGLGERLDEGCAHAAFRRSGGDIRLSVVGHDKLLARSVDLEADDNPTVLSGKSVFLSIDHELGDYKAEADGPGGLGRAPVD
jgi:hypothetical protein